MAHSSLAIANEFIRRGLVSGPITQMQLQKLVYLAHGWQLGVTGQDLIQDPFEAWEYGPVVRRLYEALRYCGRGPIIRPIKWGDDTPFKSDDDGEAVEQLTPDETSLVDAVWANYSKYHAYQLSALTHVEGSPWQKTFVHGRNNVIPNPLIADYFRQLAQQPRVQATA